MIDTMIYTVCIVWKDLTLVMQMKYNSFDIFLLFIFPSILSTISSQSIGHLLAITCGHNLVMAHILLFSLILLYGGKLTKEDDLFVLTKYLSMVNPVKETFLRIIT